MNDKEEFDFWVGAYRDEPNMSEVETRRLLLEMCRNENPYAVAELTRLAESHDAKGDDSWQRSLSKLREDLFIEPAAAADGERPGWPVHLRAPTEDQGYSADWSEIAIRLKGDRKWQCEVCKFQRSGSSLLMVHHVNRDKSDNVRGNLQVLCAVCHGRAHGGLPLWPQGCSDQERQALERHHKGRIAR